jgi:hypothetical protein
MYGCATTTAIGAASTFQFPMDLGSQADTIRVNATARNHLVVESGFAAARDVALHYRGTISFCAGIA